MTYAGVKPLVSTRWVAGKAAMPMSPTQRSLLGTAAVYASWAKTEDRTARTAAATAASMERFEREVDPDGKLDPAERARRAEYARKSYMAKLALKSVTARRRAAAAKQKGDRDGRPDSR